jgi:hypothetical protein
MPAPIGHTCPDIDKVVKRLRDIQDEAKAGMYEHERDSTDYQRYKDIEWFIDSMVDGLEDLRKGNSALRDWGEGLEGQVSALEDKIYWLEQEIENMQSVTEVMSKDGNFEHS